MSAVADRPEVQERPDGAEIFAAEYAAAQVHLAHAISNIKKFPAEYTYPAATATCAANCLDRLFELLPENFQQAILRARDEIETPEQRVERLQDALPAIRDKIKAGDVAGAVHDMTALGIDPHLASYYVRTTLNPAARLSPHQLRQFELYASPEERERMGRDFR